MGIGMQSILKVCSANLVDRLRWMSRRKALTMIKVGLSVCLAMNFRKTHSRPFCRLWRYRKFGRALVRSVRVQMRTECEAYTAAPRHRPTVQMRARCEAYGYTRLQSSLRTRRHQGTALRCRCEQGARRTGTDAYRVQNLSRPQVFQARRSPSISSTKCISRFRVCEIISPRCLASPCIHSGVNQ